MKMRVSGINFYSPFFSSLINIDTSQNPYLSEGEIYKMSSTPDQLESRSITVTSKVCDCLINKV